MTDPEVELPIFIHVPKTGGTTIKHAFEGQIQNAGHRTAHEWRMDAGPLMAFAFIRNPFARAVSMFYWAGVHDTKTFEEWCRELGPQDMEGPSRSAKRLLCDVDGELLVDTIYRFEDFDSAVFDIARRLGVRLPRVHMNKNPKKPTGLDYRTLYTPESFNYVERICAWEIDTFGYTFDGRTLAEVSGNYE